MDDTDFIGALFRDSADGGDLKIGEGGRFEWPRSPSQLNFPLKRCEDFEDFD